MSTLTRIAALALVVAACASDPPQLAQTEQSLAVISVAPITWNIVGLDSNNVTVGPDTFPVGVRITNTGDTAATSLTAGFAFTTANALINLDGPGVVSFASLAPGASVDAYFNIRVTRNSAAYGTRRSYVVTVAGTGFTTATSPTPREIFVESLVSQNRNLTVSITGPTSVSIGDVVQYVMVAKTATGGYEQLEAALTVASAGFQVLSTASTYTAPPNATNDKVYADACGWDNLPTSPTYRACIGPVQFAGGKAGGDVQVTYTVRVVGAGTFSLTGIIYDFSGASYHYNSNFGSLALTVTSGAAPIANNDSYNTNEDTALTVAAAGVLANDTDPSGGALTAVLATGPTNGALTLNSNGSFTYTPNANFSGTDTFTYRAQNATSLSTPATVTIVVAPVNDPPVNTVPGAQTTPEDTSRAITGVSIADVDAGGATMQVTLAATGGSITIGTGGLLFSTGDGTLDTTMTFTGTIASINTALASLSFAPTANVSGAASITITTSDQGNTGAGGARTDVDSIAITVTPVNDPPVANNDSATVAEDAAATPISVLTNDSIAPDTGETLTITSVTQPAGSAGTVVITGGGTGLTFQPAANTSGVVTFTYTVSDGNGGTATATVTVTVTPVNDPPTAVNDAATVAEDSGPTAVNVLGNDTAAPDAGETLTITTVTQPAGGAGTVVITGGGTGLTFQPAANASGLVTFTYTVSDGNGGTATATVTVTVTGSNDPPVALDDTGTLAEDAVATAIAVLANDSDADGDALTITAVTQPDNGTVVITGAGTGLTYQPAANASGLVTFTYTISDGNGGTATATVNVTVTPVNDPPVAVDDTATVAEDAGALPINVLGNDGDLDSASLTITAVTQPANGTVVITGGGTGLTFQPDADANGVIIFTYTISDGDGGTATATVTITVTPVNDPPVATDDTATVNEDAIATPIDVLGNDRDPDRDALTITAATQPANGTVVITGGGTGLTVEPAANASGPITFTYTISDGHGGTDTATVTVTVLAVNDPPVAVDDTATLPEDADATPLDVLGNDRDVEGGPLQITAVTQPVNGTVVISGGGTGLTFQPAANATGVVTFTYTIRDPEGGTATATVTITVTAVNDPPVAIDDAATVAEDAIATVIDVLGNDRDVDGDLLQVTAVVQPTDGTVTITGGGTGLAYQPPANFHGVVTFTYTISDGNGGTATATVTITVAEVNDPPVATDDAITVAEDAPATAIDVLATDSDVDGDALRITSVTQPASGTVVITGDGTGLTFEPAADVTGVVMFNYTISDGNGGTATASVTVTITPVNDPPVAIDDAIALAEDAAATALDVLGNDRDVDGGPLRITTVTQPASGTVVITGGGTGLTYLPPANFHGVVTFTYTVSDGNGGTATATVTVTVAPVNDTPIAMPDFAGVDPGASVVIDVRGNDLGLGDGPITTTATTPAHGTVVVNADGTITYTPTADYRGADTFEYTVTDVDGETSTTIVMVTVGLDSDEDGLTDSEELAIGTDPFDADSDDDGVLDGLEPMPGADSDGDGAIDALDPDSDNDGLKDGTELGVTTAHPDTDVSAGHFVPDADPTTTTDPLDPDTDGGGITDGTEDADHDGQVDEGEHDPNDPTDDAPIPDDADRDGVPDADDNCPTVANTEQVNVDRDPLGDACDPDADGDGFGDNVGVSGGGCSTGGDGGGLVALGLALSVLTRRRRRRHAAVVVALAAVVTAPSLAAAQVASEPRNFSVERFQLASDREGLLGVEWAEGRGGMAFDLAMWVGYANDPLVVYTEMAGDRERIGALVQNRTAAALAGSLAPTRWLTLGFHLPLVLAQDRTTTAGGAMNLESLSSFGVGDLQLSPKLTVLSQDRHGVGLAVIPAVSFPTKSSDSDYLGDAGVGFAPEVVASRSWTGWRLAINAGYHARKQARLLNLVVDDEVFARAGVGYRFADRGGPPVGIDLTITGAIAAAHPFETFNQDALEALAGANLRIGRTAILFAATGRGLREGYGTPDWRALAGLRLGSPDQPVNRVVAELDRDGDGRLDRRDRCPLEPEDADGFSDQDGCPDPDDDQDGVLDGADTCRAAPGLAELDGCPAQDTDGDTIADHVDTCPAVAEDVDSFEDTDGCPDLDNDQDGLVDADDTCPAQPGPSETRGCPDPDRDQDTVVDRLDACPDEPGPQAHSGCKTKQLVTLTGTSLEILESIYFALDKAVILPRSYKLLDNVATVLLAHGALRVEIQGHTDDQGNATHNKQLSQRRADAVRAYLMKKQVPADRLTAVGYGEDQPVAENTTKTGRAQNRRVVFKLLGEAGTTIENKQQGAGEDTKEK